MKINLETSNSFIVEDEKIAFFDYFGESIANGYDPDEYYASKETIQQFHEQFEQIKRGADCINVPYEAFHQIVNFVQLIRRKSDGQLFGFEYDRTDGQVLVEPNGDENGYEFHYHSNFDWDQDYNPVVYVFLPVQEVNITGYKIVKP